MFCVKQEFIVVLDFSYNKITNEKTTKVDGLEY